MNFFEQQDQAHRESKKLLFLFALAVIAIVLAVNGTLALLWIWMKGGHFAGEHHYPKGFFFINTAVTLLFIGGGTLVEMFRLRDGGDAVAQMAGGRLVQPDSRDGQERRLLNIVEEMSLAAGIACPRVYIMDEEDAINAFAAGYHQNEAVVAVTRGTLSRLSRDELQGVIGHEFSHIMNGDMRMNIKLIGVLFGIQMLAGFGQLLMEWGARFGSSRSRDDKGPPIQLVLFVLGVALFAIGYIGIFFGRIIKASVSRQREFLADASAVQFTRNPDGIGGALRKIGGLTRSNECGSRINNPRAEQFSHMFLGAARPNLLSGLFATHPPIKVRLERLYGGSVEFLDAEELPEVDTAEYANDTNATSMGFSTTTAATATTASTLPTSHAMGFSPEFGYHAANPDINTSVHAKNAAIPTPKLTAIPQELLRAARDPSGSSALIYALLLDRSNPQGFQAQIAILQQAVPQQCALATMLHETIETLARSTRMPLLDLAMPALKMLAPEQRTQVLGIVSRLISADQVVTQAEFVLQTVLHRRLMPQAGRDVGVRYTNLSSLKNEAALLLSLMVQTVHVDAPNQAQTAFMLAAAAVHDLGLSAEDLRPKDTIDFFEVKQALDKLNQLAPLAKPSLIRLLLQGAGQAMSIDAADLLRSVCAAIDAPLPDVMTQLTIEPMTSH